MTNVMFSTEPLEFQKYFISKFSQLSNGKYNVDQGNVKTIHTEYYEVYERSETERLKKCRFHFEIRWSGSIPLQKVKALRVAIHIEWSCDSKAPKLTEQLRAAFSERLQRNTIISEPVTVDHSTEESTIASIRCILSILEGKSFQNITDKAKEIIGKD